MGEGWKVEAIESPNVFGVQNREGMCVVMCGDGGADMSFQIGAGGKKTTYHVAVGILGECVQLCVAQCSVCYRIEKNGI